MPVSEMFPDRWLSFAPADLTRMRGPSISTYTTPNGIVCDVFDSDPMFAVVYNVNGTAVAVEHNVVNVDTWRKGTLADTTFQDYLLSL